MNTKRRISDHWIRTATVFLLLLAVLVSLYADKLPVKAAEDTAVFLSDQSDGLEVDKKIQENVDGTYTITLEQYATGRTVQTSMPADVVLVLDVSGSMDNLTLADGRSRTSHMKNTVCDFIDHMAAANGQLAPDRQSRLGIVTYANGAGVLMNMGDVTGETAAAYKNAVNGIAAGGRTRTDLGMQTAAAMLEGETRTENQVVILFTDGWPNRDDGFQPWTADAAIATAHSIKEKGGRVFAICIEQYITVADGDPLQSYSSTAGDRADGFTYCSPFMKSYGVAAPVNTSDDNLNRMTNRFFNLISSNYPNAQNLDDAGTGGATLQPVVGSYYKTAHDASALESIFAMLKTSMTTANTTLNGTAVIRDTVTEDFEIISENGIRTYGVPAVSTEDGLIWGEREAVSDLETVVDGNTLTVSGFDYSANYVSLDGHTDEPENHGKKLEVEFDIRPRTTFGGNLLETNTADSGIYRNQTAATAMKYYPVPTLCLKPDYEITASDVSAVRPDAADLTGIPGVLKEYTPDSVNNRHVEIDYTMTDEDGVTVATMNIPAATPLEEVEWTWNVTETEETKQYQIEAVVTPVDTGTYSALTRTVTAQALITEVPTPVSETTHTSIDSHEEEPEAEPEPVLVETKELQPEPVEVPEPAFLLTSTSVRQVATGDDSAWMIWGLLFLGSAVSLLLWLLWYSIHQME